MTTDAELFDPLIQATGEVVWDLSYSGTMQWHNSPYTSTLGIAGLVETSSVDDWAERLHPDDAERTLESFLTASRQPGTIWSAEYRLRRDDGTYATVIDRASVLGDEHGVPVRMVGTIRDVTAEREAERQLQEAADYADALFQSLPGPAYHFGPDQLMVRWNAAFSQVTGYPDEELALMRASDFFPPEERAMVNAAIAGAEVTGYGEVSGHLVCKDGKRLPYFFTGRLFTYDGKVGYVGIALDLSSQIALQERLRHEATHDALTGLANRSLLHEELTAAIQAAELAGHRAAVLDLDLDRFKIINDGFGHPYGDQVLRAVAARLKSLVCPEDVVARMGGDEFVILAPLVYRVEDIHEMAQRLVDSFAEPFMVEGRRIHLTGSIGVSLYPDDGVEGAELIDNADMAMYHAKAAGRSAFRAFEPAMAEEAQRRTDLETHLRTAADNGQLWLAYQPKVDLVDGTVTGCEALLRWNHPEHGLVPPCAFIPVAEESGLIVPIGEWVLETACRQGRAWLDAGLAPITIAVNISAAQLLQRDPVGWVTATLERTGFPAALLELELTESQLAQDVETTVEVIRQLRELGIRIAIDDFGTGYSSLEYLRRFDVTSLKIDRSFVDGMLTEQGDAAIVRAAVALAHAFGITVIAEGVETEDQQAFLTALQCDQIQGFLCGRPAPAEEFVALLGSSAWARGA
jgi:diguanylate cyclase (GGDEF)-like protein/PAS domain S-box-containing protein